MSGICRYDRSHGSHAMIPPRAGCTFLTNDRPAAHSCGSRSLTTALTGCGRRSKGRVNPLRAEQILQWSQQQSAPEVVFSDEQAEILDTGGGIAKALPLLGRQPFFVLNSDSFWLDGRVPALSRLRAAWDDTTMDCLLLLCHVDRTIGYDGRGDFRLGRDGRLTRQQGSGLLYRRLSRASSPFRRRCCRKILDECFVGQGHFRGPPARHRAQR